MAKPQIIDDPHHNGVSQWKYEYGKLYTKHKAAKNWVEVKRVAFTPERFVAIAKMIKG